MDARELNTTTATPLELVDEMATLCSIFGAADILARSVARNFDALGAYLPPALRDAPSPAKDGLGWVMGELDVAIGRVHALALALHEQDNAAKATKRQEVAL